MSWLVLNEILGLAVVDLNFQKELLEHPLEAVEKKHFTLTALERKALAEIKADNIYQFTTRLLELLGNENVS